MLGSVEIDEMVTDSCEEGDFTGALCIIAEYELVLSTEDKEDLLAFVEKKKAEATTAVVPEELSIHEVMALNAQTLDAGRMFY